MITEKEFSTQSLANKYWQIPLKVKYLLSKVLKWDWPVTEHSPGKHVEQLITPVQALSKIVSYHAMEGEQQSGGCTDTMSPAGWRARTRCLSHCLFL